MMTAEELTKRMNEICKKEFETNWNLGEISRVVYNDSNKDVEYNLMRRALEDELNESVQEGFKVKVDMYGTVTVYEITQKGEGYEQLREVKRVKAPWSKYLPYSYVMGRKIGKKNRDLVLEKMK